MFSILKSAFKTKDMRNRLFYTIFLIIIFRIGAHITVPGVNAAAMANLSQSGDSLFSILNTFGGGALRQYSVFAMGVSPYITASIIVQLLQMDIIPQFAEWSKHGEVGRRKLNKATIYFTIVLGFIQSIGISVGFNSLTNLGLIRNASMETYVGIAIVLTAGSMLVTWLGEQITQKGVGNGVSIIIFAGIVAQLPDAFMSLYQQLNADDGREWWIKAGFVLALLASVLFLVMFVIYMEQAKRKMPVQYSRRANVGSQMSYLPLKINSAGVIPVIFASSFMLIPATVLGFFSSTYSGESWYQILSEAFNYRRPAGTVVYILLIVLFTYFYAFVQVNPEKVAENLQKQGGYIPSVRPGKGTENYITGMLMRLSTVGSVYLALVALLPILATTWFNLPAGISLGGTSLLIVVGVAIETVRQIEGKLIKRKYQGFIQ